MLTFSQSLELPLTTFKQLSEFFCARCVNINITPSAGDVRLPLSIRLDLEAGEFVGLAPLVNLCSGSLTHRNGNMD